MVMTAGRLWRTCRNPRVAFCALSACCLVLTVFWRLWDYRYWLSSNGRRRFRALPSAAVDSDSTLAAKRVVPSDAVVARNNWNDSATVTGLDDIFISVKTTGKYHGTRIRLLLRTWLTVAQKQVITDLIFCM